MLLSIFAISQSNTYNFYEWNNVVLRTHKIGSFHECASTFRLNIMCGMFVYLCATQCIGAYLFILM